MIFVTIGSIFPFDRLVRLMDELAPRWPEETFFAQIGDGAYRPVNMEFTRSLPAPAFAEKLRDSRLLVAHAGMGSVISALEARRPIVVMPRDLVLREHNTDHQMATARWLSGKHGIHVAMDEHALPAAIDSALASPPSEQEMTSSAPPEFLAKIRSFIDQPRSPRSRR